MIRKIAGRARESLRRPAAPPVEDVDCDLGSKLTLGQFLKLANLIDSGAEAKDAIASGEVTVDGEVDTRRGRGMSDGEVVACHGRRARVRAHGTDTTHEGENR